MTDTPTKPLVISSLAKALGGYALFGGVASLLGWRLNVPRLTHWFNEEVSIQPNACVLLMLSGVAIVLVQRGAWRAVMVLGTLVGLGGALILLQHLVGTDFGINHQLLFGRTWGQETTTTPGRVGPPASTSFTLTGIALVLLARSSTQPGRAHQRRFVPWIGLAICVFMTFSLLGYLFGAKQFYTIPWLTAIALQTATMLLAVGIGLILSVPDHQPMLLLREHSGAGGLARIAIPVLLVMIPLILWIRIWGYEQGHYDLGTGRALGALTLVVGTVSLLWIALLALRRRELRESEITQRLQGILGSITDAFIALDENWGYIVVNDEFLSRLGKKRQDVIGKSMWQESTHAIANEVDERLQRAMQQRSSVEYEMYYEPLKRWYRNKAYPTADGGLAIYSQDVTERKLAEQALHDADRRKDEFLATLAHELRNPLAPVINSLAILDRVDSNESAAIDARATMGRQLKQMVRLVDDLLDVSRITRGTIELRIENIELQSVVHQAIESVRPLFEAARQELAVDLPAQPVWVAADPVRLVQIIGNLLSNASRYSESGTGISLRAVQDGEDIVLRVVDSGIGIPTAKLESIFGMFSQLDQSLERTTGGLGIGLYLVRRLVEMHGGSVEAHSEGPGTGAEFVVCLPIVAPPPLDDSLRPDVKAIAPNTSCPRILVVDDNVDAAKSMAMLLRAHGYATQTAHDGLQAVDVAESFHPAVTLLDIGLPHLNGYDVCCEIRSQPWGKNMILIAVTGWGQEEHKRRAQESGFNAHLVKPVELPQLMQMLASLLEQHERSPVPVVADADFR